jgi:hypothetical protein
MGAEVRNRPDVPAQETADGAPRLLAAALRRAAESAQDPAIRTWCVRLLEGESTGEAAGGEGVAP